MLCYLDIKRSKTIQVNYQILIKLNTYKLCQSLQSIYNQNRHVRLDSSTFVYSLQQLIGHISLIIKALLSNINFQTLCWPLASRYKAKTPLFYIVDYDPVAIFQAFDFGVLISIDVLHYFFSLYLGSGKNAVFRTRGRFPNNQNLIHLL